MSLFFDLGADIATAAMFFGLLYYLYRVSKARALWGAVQYGFGHLAYSLGSMICELLEGLSGQLNSLEMWSWSILGAVLINGGASGMLHGISRLFEYRLRGRWHKISETLAVLLVGVPILLYRDPEALLSAMDISHCLLVATMAAFMVFIHERPYRIPARLVTGSALLLFVLYFLDPVLNRLGVEGSWVTQYQAWTALDLALWMTISYGVLMLASFRAMRAFVRTSREDPLTLALNRLGFRTAHQKLAEHLPTSEPLSVIAFDLDHFKRINDEFHHAGGDQVLKAFASVLQSCGRRTDAVARFGGEEFVLLMPGANEAAALRVAELVRERAAQAEVPIQGKVARFTTSAGVASGRMGDNIDHLLAEADAALFRAKQNGRNRVESAHPGYAPTFAAPMP